MGEVCKRLLIRYLPAELTSAFFRTIDWMQAWQRASMCFPWPVLPCPLGRYALPGNANRPCGVRGGEGLPREGPSWGVWVEKSRCGPRGNLSRGNLYPDPLALYGPRPPDPSRVPDDSRKCRHCHRRGLEISLRPPFQVLPDLPGPRLAWPVPFGGLPEGGYCSDPQVP